ncbi:MAG TPA: hypothetical protein VF168_06115 [Trueperaceae bacterium]
MKDEPDEKPDSDEGELGERDLKYGEAFGTQRDRSSTQEEGYLDSEFGSREFTPPDQNRSSEEDEEREG